MTDKQAPLDILSLTPGEREIQLTRPDGTNEKLPIWIRLMSADDARLKRYQRHLIDRRQERQRKGKVLSAEEMENGLVELLARAIVGWKFEVVYDGEIPEFSHKKAVQLLSDSRIPWFFTQINEAIGDSESFF